MNDIVLTHEPLDTAVIQSKVVSPACGAVSLFVGTTRDSFNGKEVTQLEYEAYEPMAVKELTALAEDLRKKFDVHNIAIHHRLGVVPVTEASVVIAISSPHRKASLEAVSHAIDALKANAPIFKKEFYREDQPAWKANPECEVIADNSIEVETNLQSEVPPEFVQINVTSAEINRRIESFMRRKREELNRSNLRDFCFHGPIVEKTYTCARVDAVLIRNKNSKSHLKVCRVQNAIGPQVEKSVEKSTLSPSKFQTTVKSCPEGAEERLSNAEKFLGLSNPTSDVFVRLKAIEDRILHLESLSPEYFSMKDPTPQRGLKMNF